MPRLKRGLTHVLRVRWPALAGVSLVLLAGCASTPVVRLHSLLPAQSLAAAPEAGRPIAIHLASLTVPPAVDQSAWLVRLPDGSLLALAQDRWASPLRDELRAALRDWLGQRWGVVDNRDAAAWRLTVEVTRFESIAAVEARIEARWSVLPLAPAAPGAKPVDAIGCRAVLREPVAAGSQALAEGHQRAVARLADRIGRQLRAAQRGEPWVCEADAP